MGGTGAPELPHADSTAFRPSTPFQPPRPNNEETLVFQVAPGASLGDLLEASSDRAAMIIYEPFSCRTASLAASASSSALAHSPRPYELADLHGGRGR